MQLQLVRQQTIVLGSAVVTDNLEVKVLTETLQPFHQSLQLAAAAVEEMVTPAPQPPVFRRRHRLVFQEALAVEVVVGKALVVVAQVVWELQINLHRQDQAQ
jgi:hypothetical protein